MKIDFSNFTKEQNALIHEYCENDMKKLKEICFFVWGQKGLPTCYHDDLYSDAMKVLIESVVSFNPDGNAKFKTYLVGNLRKSYKDWYRDNYYRAKRSNLEFDEHGKIKKDENGNPIVIQNVSFDTPVDDGVDLCEKVASDFNVENELPKEINYGYSENIESFLNNLTGNPRKISEMIMDGYSVNEIKEKLNLTDKQYRDCWKTICSYENKRILYKENNKLEDDEMNITVLTEDVVESYKNTSYSIDSISKQLQKKRIRDDHILQRHSGQWKGFAKSELISDILRGKSLTQIIISEEIKNGLRMQWLIDGKQRCTTLDDYLHDGFAISKNVKNYNIRYQTTKTDEDGNEILNEDGFTEMEFKEFDIRNKKFSQLPEELQEIFRDRQIPVLYNMNCTKKDIADDIARFNRSRPMNKAQNGWLGLDESFAEFVENIAKMQFFQTDFCGSSYTNNNRTSGVIRRIIVEGIMVSDFIDDFNKDFNKMCEYLSDEASDSNFTEFYSLVERLTAVCNEDTSHIFNAKDSFLWFGLFSRFIKISNDDKKFVDFIIEFNETLHSKVINGKSFDDLNGKSTKDKTIVIEKMKHLESLMMGFLDVKSEDLEEATPLEVVKENVNPEVTQEDIEDYESDLEILSLDVDNESKLLDDKNKPSLIAMIAYGYRNDVSIDSWFKTYFENNNTYLLNQKENYLHMKADFEKYLGKNEVV